MDFHMDFEPTPSLALPFHAHSPDAPSQMYSRLPEREVFKVRFSIAKTSILFAGAVEAISDVEDIRQYNPRQLT